MSFVGGCALDKTHHAKNLLYLLSVWLLRKLYSFVGFGIDTR